MPYKDPERQRTAVAAYADANPEKVKAANRKSYARNKAVVAARSRIWHAANKEKVSERQKAWRAENPDKVRSQHLTRTYGITLEQYNEMLAAQDHKCAVCGVKDGECGGHGNKLVVDHMHCSGKVRALLCSRCNTVEGLLRGDPNIAYAMAFFMRHHKPTLH